MLPLQTFKVRAGLRKKNGDLCLWVIAVATAKKKFRRYAVFCVTRYLVVAQRATAGLNFLNSEEAQRTQKTRELTMLLSFDRPPVSLPGDAKTFEMLFTKLPAFFLTKSFNNSFFYAPPPRARQLEVGFISGSFYF